MQEIKLTDSRKFSFQIFIFQTENISEVRKHNKAKCGYKM